MAENEVDGTEEALRDADEIVARWRSEYEACDAATRQDILFNLMCTRLFWRLVCYMRRYPHRLVSSEKTYTDRCVGSEELESILTFGESLSREGNYCIEWLDAHRVPTSADADFQLALVSAHIETLLSVPDDGPILRLMHGFGLNETELEILVSMVAIMSTEDLLKLMTVAWADFSVRLPTVSFLIQLLGSDGAERDAVYSAFREDGILRQMRLILLGKRIEYPYETPRLYSPVHVDQSVVDAFFGRSRQGAYLPGMSIVESVVPKRRLLGASEIVESIEYAIEGGAQNVCLCGAPHSGRRTILSSLVGAKSGKSLLEVDFSHMLASVPSVDIVDRLAGVMREAVLAHSELVLRLDALETTSDIAQKLTENAASIAQLSRAYPSKIFILAPSYMPVLDDAFGKPAMIEIAPPSVEQARSIWMKALVGGSKAEREKMADVFSRNYALPIGNIFTVVRDATEQARKDATNGGNGRLKSHHILNEIRKSFRHQLGTLAEITVSDVPLSGVVLTDEAKVQVDEILEYANQLHCVLDTWGFRQRSPYGNALSVLFAGPPGTGKTLLACALANELGKVLYRVDLSRIVDKYIGETEKNLGKIFDEAAKAQAIILFDEADSLFAKRTEVKSSNDRYANLEINFLLQKLESFDGMTILTTNLSKSIDDAFRRRIRFIVDFPMPDVDARVKLWQRMMPPGAPIAEDIRWKWLARTFEMSGGYIRNAVLKASISAAARHKPIDMACLVSAAEAQARSMGQLIRISDDEYYDDDDDYDDA